MKTKTTYSAIRSNYSKVYSIGYCGAQNLLRYETPRAYCAGVYGWNCDLYTFGSIAITTGYRPIGQSIDYAIVKKYDDMARAIQLNHSLHTEEKQAKTTALLIDFVENILNR